MMHPYSPSRRWLAVPGIGFPQNISVGPNALDLEDFWDRPVLPIQKNSGLPKGLLGIFAADYTRKVAAYAFQTARELSQAARMTRHGSDDVRRATTPVHHAARRRGGVADRGAGGGTE